MTAEPVGGACRRTAEQQDKLKAWITATLPRRACRDQGMDLAGDTALTIRASRRVSRFYIALSMEHRKPTVISR